jgi:23S rRNA maturation mini-RNase III
VLCKKRIERMIFKMKNTLKDSLKKMKEKARKKNTHKIIKEIEKEMCKRAKRGFEFASIGYIFIKFSYHYSFDENMESEIISYFENKGFTISKKNENY